MSNLIIEPAQRMKAISLRLPPRIFEAVQDLARDHSTTEAAVLRQIVVDFFSPDRLQKSDDAEVDQ